MLTEKTRKKIIDKLPEATDTELSAEFQVSRKTVWRLRQQQGKPNLQETMQKVEIQETKAPAPIVLNEKVSPKVDTEPVHLTTYFAVQVLRGENYRKVALSFLDAAERSNVLFRKLQVLDILTVGATPFVRFRTDLQSIEPVVKAMGDRAYVAADQTGGYGVHFVGGRTGKYPTSIMLLQAKMGFGQTYAATRIARWRHQFTSV